MRRRKSLLLVPRQLNADSTQRTSEVTELLDAGWRSRNIALILSNVKRMTNPSRAKSGH